MGAPVYFHNKPCYQPHNPGTLKVNSKKLDHHVPSNNHQLPSSPFRLASRGSINAKTTAILLTILLLATPILVKANDDSSSRPVDDSAHPNYDPPESTSVSVEPSYDPPGASISVSDNSNSVGVSAYSDGSGGFVASNENTAVYAGVDSDGSLYGGVEHSFN